MPTRNRVKNRANTPATPRIPSYRTRPGYTQAIVTLTDSATGKRRDYWLGAFNTPASREKYYRLIAEWEAAGRRFPESLETPRLPPSFPAGPPASSLRAVGAAGTSTARGARGVFQAASGSGERPTVARLIMLYWRGVGASHKFKRAFNIKAALRVLRRLEGTTPAEQFGPRRLRVVREAMVLGDPSSDPPRRPWSRRTVNDRVRVIINMFRWAASQELLPPAIPQALAMVDALKPGQTCASEGRRVEPVPEEMIAAVRPLVSRQVRALIDLQLLTGARPGELLGLRPMDIQTRDDAIPRPEEPPGRCESEAWGSERTRGLRLSRRSEEGSPRDAHPAEQRTTVWSTRLRDHKNAHRGKERTLYFGPRAQAVLAPFLAGRDPAAPLFSPAEAERERRAEMHARRVTPAGYGNSPGTNKSPSPRRPPRDAYTTDTYRRAIERACDEAFPPPPPLARLPHETVDQWKGRLSPSMRVKLTDWRRDHRWHPHQLRHNAATVIRREHGLEAAALVLGHASATITDAVYAERDNAKIKEVIRRCG